MKKNTVSLLEAIKKKISKIDESDKKAAEQNLGDEFEYVEKGESSAEKNSDDQNVNNASQGDGSDVDDINLESSIEESVSDASDSESEVSEKVAEDTDGFDLSFDDNGADKEPESDLDFGDLDNMENLDVDAVPTAESDNEQVDDQASVPDSNPEDTSEKVDDQNDIQESEEGQDNFLSFDEVSQEESKKGLNSDFLRHVGDQNQEQEDFVEEAEDSNQAVNDDEVSDVQSHQVDSQDADSDIQSGESLTDEGVQSLDRGPELSQEQEFEIDEFDQISADSDAGAETFQSDKSQDSDKQEVLNESHFDAENLAQSYDKSSDDNSLPNADSHFEDSNKSNSYANDEFNDEADDADENFELDEDIAGEEDFEIEEDGDNENIATEKRFTAQSLSSVKTNEDIIDESEFEEDDYDDNISFDDLEDDFNISEQSVTENEEVYSVANDSPELQNDTSQQKQEAPLSSSSAGDEGYKTSTKDLNDQMEEFLNSDTAPEKVYQNQDPHPSHSQIYDKEDTEESVQELSAVDDPSKAENYNFQTKYFSEEPNAEYKTFEYLEKDISINSKISEKVSKTIKNIAETKQMISDVDGFVGGGMLSHVAFELMKPKLEVWLEANLPGLVENVVRQEIRKIISEESK